MSDRRSAEEIARDLERAKQARRAKGAKLRAAEGDGRPVRWRVKDGPASHHYLRNVTTEASLDDEEKRPTIAEGDY